MTPDNKPAAAERCTHFHACGIMRQGGVRARDSGAYYVTDRGMAHAPRERLVTISGRLNSQQPYQKLQIVIEEAWIAHCADANATVKMKCLGLPSARVALTPDQRYVIRGLSRNWCTTTYVLSVQVDDQPPARHTIHLQGIASIQQREPWQSTYDLTLSQ